MPKYTYRAINQAGDEVSGNLEADLLSMRYINHYLSVQQQMFPVNKWQVVKIELSAQNK